MIVFNKQELRYACVAILAIVGIAFGGAYIWHHSGHRSAVTALAKANVYRANQDMRSARIELLNAAASDPKFAEAYTAQAEVALALFDGAGARTAIEKSVGAGTPQPQLQHLLGHALWLEGDLERAQSALEDDSILAKNRVYANRILGRVYLDQGNIDDARSAFDRAIKIDPKDSMLWTDIAAFRLKLMDQKGAIDAAEYAVSMDDRNIRAIEMRGRLVRSQYGLAAAIPWFEKGLSIASNDVPLLEEYAVTLGEIGRNRDMLKYARKILTLNPKSGRAYYMQAVMAARATEYMLAQRMLSLAGSAINDTPGAMLVMAISEYQLGNYNRASDTLERLLSLQPNNIEARKMLARAKQSAGENLDALDAIKPLVMRGNADAYSAMIAARAFEAGGDRVRAVGGLNDAATQAQRKAALIPENLTLNFTADAARRNPGNAAYVIPYIRALMLDGQTELALAQAKQLQTNAPGVAAAHMLVGDVETARGNYAAAVVAYQKTREIAFSEGIMLRLVDVYRRQKNWNTSREVLDAFMQLNPGNLAGQRLTAYLHIDDGQWAAALPLLVRLRGRLGYNDSALNANIVRTYSGLGRHDEAVFNAKVAYEIDPANPMVTLAYAQAALKSGTHSKAALELFEKSNAMNPGNMDTVKGLKAARLAVKKTPKAKSVTK
jgi:cellulose synthase operon protein C